MRASIAWALVLAASWNPARASAAAEQSPPQATVRPGADPAPVSEKSSEKSSDPSAGTTGEQPLSPEDQELLREIERATGGPQTGGGEAPAAPTSPGSAAGATAPEPPAPGTLSPAATARTSGLFPNIYNPALSVNGLFLGSVSSVRHPPPDAVPTALSVQELELQFIANVDPYFTANLLFSIPGGEGFELEEGFVTPAWKPAGLELRLGRFRAPFGRENPMHTHALPFIDRSLVNVAVFGDEGLRETGVELSYLVPLPWYATVTVAAYNGDNEVLFESPDPYQKAALATARNVFDLNDDTTLELGASYTVGHDDEERLSQAAGAHLVVKWHPARAFRRHQAILTAEVIWATRPNVVDALPVEPGAGRAVGGGYLWAEWQLAQRWFVLGRFDYLGFPEGVHGTRRRGSALVAFTPTEFSAVRAQLSAGSRPDVDGTIYEGLVQLDITLGAHPAHAY